MLNEVKKLEGLLADMGVKVVMPRLFSNSVTLCVAPRKQDKDKAKKEKRDKKEEKEEKEEKVKKEEVRQSEAKATHLRPKIYTNVTTFSSPLLSSPRSSPPPSPPQDLSSVNICAKRTLKVMKALVSGIPILTMDWVEECVRMEGERRTRSDSKGTHIHLLNTTAFTRCFAFRPTRRFTPHHRDPPSLPPLHHKYHTNKGFRTFKRESARHRQLSRREYSSCKHGVGRRQAQRQPILGNLRTSPW